MLLIILITIAHGLLDHEWVLGAVTGVILAAILNGTQYYKHYW